MCMSVFKGDLGGFYFIKFQVCLKSHGIPGQYFLLLRVPCDCKKWGK